MKQNRVLLLFFVIVSVSVLFITFMDVFSHERVHKQIMSYYGCKNISIDLVKMETRCLDANHFFSDKEKELHSFNEIYSYNMESIKALLSFIVILLCLVFLVLNKNEQK